MIIDDPLVSIITPVYNHERYIGRCIESLLAQTYTKWEMIVVDDGSTDGTAEVVKSYDDCRITYLYQQNRGVGRLASTINEGLSRSKGDLVTMFPSDDTWPPYRLEKQVPVFNEKSVVLCFGRQYLIDANDNIIGETPLPRFESDVVNRPVGSVLSTLLVWNWLPQTTVLISSEALEEIGGYLQPDGLLAEDYPTQLALALKGEFRYVDAPLAYYRMHGQQQTRLHRLEMTKTDATYVLEFFRDLAPDVRELTGWTDGALVKKLSERIFNSYFEEGRRALLRGDEVDARRQFRKALLHGSVKTKAKAMIGLSCTFLGVDLEKMVQVLGRPPLG